MNSTHYRTLALLIFLYATWTSQAHGGSPAKESVTHVIDGLIRQQWNDYQIKPSREASDGEWVRRVYLDLLGRIPSISEYQAFTRSSNSRRKELLIDQLLYDDRYTAEFARNWGTVWTNVLIGRTGGNERNSLINRDGMQKYLRDAFARNQSYRTMVQDLITAEGTNKPGLKQFNGAVNFLSMKLADEAAQATADTSRIFLGKQVQCTQCHDHPFNDWKQNQFWELNSFFRQAVSLRRFDSNTEMVSYVELTDQDFGGEGNTPDEAEVYFEVRDATLKAAYPVFIDGDAIPNKSGRLSDVNRRQELAKFIVNSEEMPRAIVNRMWAHFFNYGFTSPIDDMGPHNPPTHPELLEFVAKEFASNSYDLRLLMKWIVSSEAYSLSSRMGKRNKIDDPSKGERPLFSRFYIRQMRAEELFDSLITATRADQLGRKNQFDDKRRDWLKQFVVAFGNDEGTEGSTFDGTITQALVLFNGELTREALSDKPNGLLQRIDKSKANLDQKVHRLFQIALCRKATKKERQAAAQMVQWRDGNSLEALQDLWWAILNSNEFILNH